MSEEDDIDPEVTYELPASAIEKLAAGQPAVLEANVNSVVYPTTIELKPEDHA